MIDEKDRLDPRKSLEKLIQNESYGFQVWYMEGNQNHLYGIGTMDSKSSNLNATLVSSAFKC